MFSDLSLPNALFFQFSLFLRKTLVRFVSLLPFSAVEGAWVVAKAMEGVVTEESSKRSIRMDGRRGRLEMVVSHGGEGALTMDTKEGGVGVDGKGGRLWVAEDGVVAMVFVWLWPYELRWVSLTLLRNYEYEF